MQGGRGGLRFGLVAEVDAARGRARVTFPGEDGMGSHWLCVTAPATGRTKIHQMPDPGENVAVLLDAHGEAGVILGAVYSTPEPPPVDSADKTHVAWPDGASAEYDRASHAMLVDVPAGGTITARVGAASIDASNDAITLAVGGSSITINAAGIFLSAPTVGMTAGGGSGNATLAGNFAMRGQLAVTGDVSATGTVMDGGGNSNHHSH